MCAHFDGRVGVDNQDVGKTAVWLISVHSVMLKLDPTTDSGKCNHFDNRLNCLMATITKNCSGEEVNTFVFSINYEYTEYYNMISLILV